MRAGLLCIVVACAAAGIGCGDDAGVDPCEPLPFEVGGDGHDQPLASGPGEARAGRLTEAANPGSPSGLGVWEAGDFVLANSRIAVVIEDVGLSELYDPWGGKPVGVMRVADGALVEPADFGEFFILTARYSLLAMRVGVLSDGSDGGPAIVRAEGVLRPTPFFENIVGALLREEVDDIVTAIDYVLEPDADHVDIVVRHRSPRDLPAEIGTTLHGFMYTPRTPTYAPDVGFDTESKKIPYLAFVDDDATSWAYSVPGQELGAGVSASGFTSNFTDGYVIAPCGESERHHARLTVGGPGLDGLRQAIVRTQGQDLRAVTGTVTDAEGAPAPGVRVHAETAGGDYVTRAMTDSEGSYRLHVPPDTPIELTTWRRGDGLSIASDLPEGAETMDFQLPAAGAIRVTVEDLEDGAALPARVQVLPVSGSPAEPPGHFGEPRVAGGRVAVEYPMDGEVTIPIAAGEWRVVVSRGFEYELHETQVTVEAGATAEVAAVLDRVVDTPGVMCADYHIHTIRSADSGDDGRLKVASAIADGLEIPIRSEHEYAQSFAPEVAALGAEAWAYGMASVELTTMETWGHFGVLPIAPDPAAINGGTPLWQEYPTPAEPDVFLRTKQPPEVFDQVRSRPEEPVIIINHPRGGANYFEYVGYDPVTAMPTYPELWDEQLGLVEVFNGSGWTDNRDGVVVDWLSLLSSGHRVFAVGSSDSHAIYRSPVGYPRTCLELGTDDPTQLTDQMVRDATAAGHSTIVGGIYVDARVGEAGPGDDVPGAPATVSVDVTVQAASWVGVDWIDVVVDGETVETIAVLPQDADPIDPTIRFDAAVQIQVAPGAGSYVIVAAYGDGTLDPVHAGRQPFGVTNPIFLRP